MGVSKTIVVSSHFDYSRNIIFDFIFPSIILEVLASGKCTSYRRSFRVGIIEMQIVQLNAHGIPSGGSLVFG